MKLEIITLDGDNYNKNCDTFEFRSNTVANWVKIKKNGWEEIIHRVATIKFDGDRN